MVSGAFATSKANALEFQPMPFMAEYLEQQVAEDRHPEHVRAVRNGLHHFAVFCRSSEPAVERPEDITRLDIVRFQRACNERVASGEWSKSYSIQVLKKVRAWINWMSELEYITTMPWASIKLGTVKKEPKPLSDEDMARLYAAHADDARTTPFMFHRRDLILTLLYGWGLRVSELMEFTVQDFDMRNDFVRTLNAKSNGGRKTQPFTPEIKAHVQRWLNARARHQKPGVDALLITTTGTPMTTTQVRTTISELGAKAGVKVNPHRLRDTCGTNLLNDGVPAEQVQTVYGHSQLAQTLAYAKVNDKTVFASVQGSMDPRLRLLFRSTRTARQVR